MVILRDTFEADIGKKWYRLAKVSFSAISALFVEYVPPPLLEIGSKTRGGHIPKGPKVASHP